MAGTMVPSMRFAALSWILPSACRAGPSSPLKAFPHASIDGANFFLISFARSSKSFLIFEMDPSICDVPALPVATVIGTIAGVPAPADAPAFAVGLPCRTFNSSIPAVWRFSSAVAFLVLLARSDSASAASPIAAAWASCALTVVSGAPNTVAMNALNAFAAEMRYPISLFSS